MRCQESGFRYIKSKMPSGQVGNQTSSGLWDRNSGRSRLELGRELQQNQDGF